MMSKLCDISPLGISSDPRSYPPDYPSSFITSNVQGPGLGGPNRNADKEEEELEPLRCDARHTVFEAAYPEATFPAASVTHRWTLDENLIQAIRGNAFLSFSLHVFTFYPRLTFRIFCGGNNINLANSVRTPYAYESQFGGYAPISDRGGFNRVGGGPSNRHPLFHN